MRHHARPHSPSSRSEHGERVHELAGASGHFGRRDDQQEVLLIQASGGLRQAIENDLEVPCDGLLVDPERAVLQRLDGEAGLSPPARRSTPTTLLFHLPAVPSGRVLPVRASGGIIPP